MSKQRHIDLTEASIGEPAPQSTAQDVSLPPSTARPGREDPVIRSGKLAGLGMWHAIWVLSWPVLIESFLTSLVGVTDTTLSAGVSQAATDAIGGASYFMWFVGLLSIALGVGATAMISRAAGKGRLALGSAVVGQCTTLSLLGGVLVSVFIVLIAPTIATWLSLSGEAKQHCITYIRLCALAVPLQTFAQVGISCCRGVGDSMRPLSVMLVVNGVNLVASFLLSGVDVAVAAKNDAGVLVRRVLIENPSPLNMGVAGIALGTAVAWSVGGIMIFAMLAKGVHGVRLRTRFLSPHWHTIRRLLRIGLPNLSETFGMWLGNFILILMVGWMNNDGWLGAHVLAVRIEAFSFLPGFAMSLAAATLAGTYLGAGSPRTAHRAVLNCLYVSIAIMGAFGVAFMTMPRAIVGLFSQQPVHLEVAPMLLPVFGSVQAIFAISIVLRSALRGAGDTTSVMWITWISVWAIRMPLAWICCGVDLPLPGGGSIPNPAPLQAMGVHPLVGFEIGLCIEIVLRSTMFAWVFFKGKWSEKEV